jgi:hypothetical protein
MAVFLFATATVAVVMGLVSFVAGHMLRTAGRQQGPRTTLES